jgi:hypothetical protein
VSLARQQRFTPQKCSLVVIYVRGSVSTRTIMRLEGLYKLKGKKEFNDLTGNETRDLRSVSVIARKGQTKFLSCAPDYSLSLDVDETTGSVQHNGHIVCKSLILTESVLCGTDVRGAVGARTSQLRFEVCTAVTMQNAVL